MNHPHAIYKAFPSYGRIKPCPRYTRDSTHASSCKFGIKPPSSGCGSKPGVVAGLHQPACYILIHTPLSRIIRTRIPQERALSRRCLSQDWQCCYKPMSRNGLPKPIANPVFLIHINLCPAVCLPTVYSLIAAAASKRRSTRNSSGGRRQLLTVPLQLGHMLAFNLSTA